MSLQPRYCHIWLVTHASYSMTTTSNGHRKSSPSSIFAPISVSRPRPRLRLRLTSLASHAPYMRRRSRTLLSWDTKREHPGSIAHPGAYSENVGSELSVWLMVQSRCARRRYLPASCPSPSNSDTPPPGAAPGASAGASRHDTHRLLRQGYSSTPVSPVP